MERLLVAVMFVAATAAVVPALGAEREITITVVGTEVILPKELGGCSDVLALRARNEALEKALVVVELEKTYQRQAQVPPLQPYQQPQVPQYGPQPQYQPQPLSQPQSAANWLPLAVVMGVIAFLALSALGFVLLRQKRRGTPAVSVAPAAASPAAAPSAEPAVTPAAPPEAPESPAS